MEQKIQDVAFIIQTLGMGGAEVFLTDLMQEWRRTGVKLEAWITYPRFRTYLTDHGISVRRLATVSDVVGNWKGLVKALLFLPYALCCYGWVWWQTRHTQVIIASGFAEKILGGWWAKVWRRPVVWFEFGPMTRLLTKFKGLPWWLYRSVVNTPTVVIVPSEHTRRHLLKDGLIAADKIVVVPCGRAVPVLSKTGPAPANKVPTVVCVSRLEPGKGQDLLVQAWPAVLEHIPTAQLLIAGEGDFDTNIQKEIKRLHLHSSVQMLGRVSNALELLQSATVCVFPSVWALEGFGMVTIEAMALSKPIVAFATGPTPEIIKDQQTGLLVPPGNIPALSQALIQLLQNPALRIRLGQAAQRRFQERYTIERSAAAYRQVIMAAIET